MSLRGPLSRLAVALGAFLLLSACAEPGVPSSPTPESAAPAPTAGEEAPATPGEGAKASPAPSGAEWTFLVYINADHNLEPFALTDLDEMASVGSSSQVQVVVQVDRRADRRVTQGVLNLPNWTSTKRLLVEKGCLKEMADLGEANMDDPQVLADFIRWGTKTYPARRYSLVLWDHGGAFLGFGGDSTGGRGSIMTLPTIATALEKGGVTFELLGFDACLMAAVEVALELQPYARALVVSEELEPGPGWDYTAVLGALARNPRMTGIELGKAVADTYLAFYKKSSPAEGLYVTLSVVDLAEMPTVAAELTAFGADLRRYVLEETQTDAAEQFRRLGQFVGRVRFETPGFGRERFTDPGLTFDLGLLADNTAKATGNAALGRKIADLRAALAKAVVYSVAGEGFRDAPLGGLSLHLPVYETQPGRVERYSQLVKMKETKWSVHAQAFSEAGNADKTPPVVGAPVADNTLVVPGQAKAVIKGEVTDETMVTGVIVGVVGVFGEDAVLFSFEEQPRSYAKRNDYSYTFDGMGWYLASGEEVQPVFSVQWRPGQRASSASIGTGPRRSPSGRTSCMKRPPAA